MFTYMRNVLLGLVDEPIYSNYRTRPYPGALVNGLVDTLELAHRMPTTELRRKISAVTNEYPPFPTTPIELRHTASLVNSNVDVNVEGYNNSLFENHIQGEDTIIKALNFQINVGAINLLREAFVNMVIINEMIDQGVPHLVPTYGMFFCDKPNGVRQSVPICIVPHHASHYPVPYMIQKRLDGQSFASLLDDRSLPPMSLSQLLGYMTQLFDTLIQAQESPYRLTHGDLKCDNIYVTRTNELYILDWGITGFTYKGKRYSGYVDEHYSNGEPFINGALDTFHLLKSLLQGGYISMEAERWVSESFDQLFGHAFGMRLDVYDRGTQLLDLLRNDRFDGTHARNVAHMNRLTYRFVANHLGIEARPKQMPNIAELERFRLQEAEEVGYEKGFGKKKTNKSKKSKKPKKSKKTKKSKKSKL